MFNFNPDVQMDDDVALNVNHAIAMFAVIAASAYAFVKYAESNNHLDYENPYARMIAGFLRLYINTMHTKAEDIRIKNTPIVVAMPHRTGWEALVIASKMEKPLHFLATDKYNNIPFVSSFMNLFNVITVSSKKEKGLKKTKNNALIAAGNVLNNHNSVALFPQGRFAKIGMQPAFIYNGAVELALEYNQPISVIRLDGFYSLENPYIPLSIRNNDYYRAIISALHPNNIRVTLAKTIDLHITPNHMHLSRVKKREMKEEINAQMYAYARHTKELTPQQVSLIQTQEISSKLHLLIWRNKVNQTAQQKKEPILIARKHRIEQRLLDNKREYVELMETINTPEERQPLRAQLLKKRAKLRSESKTIERQFFRNSSYVDHLRQEEVELRSISSI